MADETAAVQEAPPTEAAPPQGSDASAAEPSQAPDPYAAAIAALEGLDPGELIKRYQPLSGKLGDLASKQAARQAEQMARQQIEAYQQQQQAAARVAEAKAEREKIRKLAETDPDRLAQEMLVKTAEQEYQESNAALEERVRADYYGRIDKQLAKIYERPDVAAALEAADDATRWRLHYRNPIYENREDALAELTANIAEYVADWKAEKKAADKAKPLARTLADAMAKDAASESMAAAAAEGIDLGLGGLAPGNKIWKTSEIHALSREEFRKHEREITRQMEQGLLVDDRGFSQSLNAR